MYSVNVVTDGQRFYAEVENKRLDYRFAGRVFEQGPVVEGRFAGERRAAADADDWRAKLRAAGLKVE